MVETGSTSFTTGSTERRPSGIRGPILFKQCPAGGHLFVSESVRQETVVTDPHKSAGQNVQQESAQELGSVERHRFLAATVCVVLPTEADLAVLQGDQTLIRDRHSMGVPCQVLQHLRRATERRLGVHNPVGSSMATSRRWNLRESANPLSLP